MVRNNRNNSSSSIAVVYCGNPPDDRSPFHSFDSMPALKVGLFLVFSTSLRPLSEPDKGTDSAISGCRFFDPPPLLSFYSFREYYEPLCSVCACVDVFVCKNDN